ncbi:TRAP transporter substrate-binding protein [Verticiella sediminum]|uniref:TRAP transporter substrate-binding protein n=1 Tax=Verticiella sediminum TaxID=1247510 RepID=A0A556AZY3_9BURK|nr:TRAP transporter substrate-binding protein [Verticiella sediminum]TSH98045.1 TRAP transporter substrate-binding protein [Verticiella sediminum]
MIRSFRRLDRSFTRGIAVLVVGAAATLAHAHAQAQVTLRAVGQTSNTGFHVPIEREFFEQLAQTSGVDLKATITPADVAGIQNADALRLLRNGTFDVMSVQIGQAARDDPFIEGIDLVGVATDMASIRKAVDAYREVLDQRLQKRFNAKVLTLWPFGPQVIFCKSPLAGVADLKGRKVRVFTASMSALVSQLGGVGVTMPTPEVYPALERGVVECAISAAWAGNLNKWPEITDRLLPLGLSSSVQGHFINLNTWNKFSPEEQAKLTAQFDLLEERLWQLAESLEARGIECNTGQGECASPFTRFSMGLAPVAAADQDIVKKAVQEAVLPAWKKTCDAIEPTCSATWNGTVGASMGVAIP